MNVSGTLDIATVSAALTDRERFLAVLFNGPLLPSDAVVVFSGDGKMRLDAAVGILRQRAAHWAVVSGGVDDPPHSLNAADSARYLVERGLHPERIICDNDSQNTRDQAEYLAALCARMNFERVLLSTSPYHMPRAFLTVLASLRAAGLSDSVVVLPLPAGNAPWTGKPDGLEVTRMGLFDGELRKIEEYRAKGHVASYAEGLAYLMEWEQSE